MHVTIRGAPQLGRVVGGQQEQKPPRCLCCDGHSSRCFMRSSSSIRTATPWGGHRCDPYTDEETEPQRRKVTCPVSHS